MVSDTKRSETRRKNRDKRQAHKARKARHKKGTPKFPIQPPK